MNSTFCIPPDIRSTLVDIIAELDIANNIRNSILDEIGQTPDCAEEAKSGKKASKTKRAPSAYNIHIGECMKRLGKGVAAPDRMRQCAGEWRQKSK